MKPFCCLISFAVTCSVAFAPGAWAQQSATQPKPAAAPRIVGQGRDGRLTYLTDDRGNRVPDFSYAGYRAGEQPIPNVPVRVVVSAVEGDNTARIQAAIDYVSSLPADQRGAVLLAKGRYEIAGALKIAASNVVLRGSGPQTLLVASGTDRRTLITIAGADDRKIDPNWIAVQDDYVPVNARRLRLRSGHGLKPADTILIRRPSTPEWIRRINMTNLGGERHGFGWRPGSRDILWDRTIVTVEGDTITLDAPITTALESDLGGGSVAKYDWPGRISGAGVENLRCESSFDPANPKDENHSWFAIVMENARDSWVRQVSFAHFAGSAVALWESCSRITVEDCKSVAPVSEIGGWRRNAFFTAGQQTLFQRCWSEDGIHDFAVGFMAAGPNAFVQCHTLNSLGDSGPIDSWASGVLFDNVRIDGNAISFMDRRYRAQGAGWAAANSMIWQSHAAVIHCFSPPGATNWAVGCWATFDGDGQWQSCNDSVEPDSLYYAQLAERIGHSQAMQRAQLLLVASDPSSSPSIEVAAALTQASKQPGPWMPTWIDDAGKRNPIPIDAGGARSIDEIARSQLHPPPSVAGQKQLTIENGWIVADGKLLVGTRQSIPWWRGSTRPAEASRAGPAVTRFVPGRSGPGYTDNLDDVVKQMIQEGKVALEQHYALWYDRRRDDHERIRRMDGDVWPPFYEVPFARSGQGVAWDGLSKYDLTRPNPWYWSRLREFASLCDQHGLVLIHQQYFQHNILEAGAHWADFAWRTANNINNTGFPEPPNYAGDKRIFMAEQFYDVSHPTRRALHRQYIRQCLEALAGQRNVIHLTSEEFTGPLHFMQFWIDTIAEWKREKGQAGRHVLIGLSATRDVQDAILADPTRAALVDVIDIRYWKPQADGTFYAPPGGANLAPRQHARQLKPKPSSFESIVRAVRDYRTRFPDKAVVYSVEEDGEMGLAALMGGSSLPRMRPTLDSKLLEAIPKMKPVELPGNPPGQFALAEGDRQYLIYTSSDSPVAIDASGYEQHRFDVGRGAKLVWLVRR
ncbi:DUF6298 domain-containing protein [Fontivita pretiosa]|uniref:DUF6298 domain-containing protein n=1 Tax=Fontivita pretiosa TaxID=2989684 RepID=UPI003D1634A9